MKIVFLGRYNESEKLNGPEKFAKRLFGEIAAKNADSFFIGYFFKGSQSSFMKRLIGKKELNTEQHIFQLGILRIFLFLMKEQPDIIHIVTHERFIISLFIYKSFLKGKIIVTHHSVVKVELNNTILKLKKYGRFKDVLFERLSFKYADRHVFVSELLLESSIKHYSFDKKKVVIIPNGVDGIFSFAGKTIDVEKKLRILFYNGFNNVFSRGLNFVIDTLNQLSSYYPFELIVLGEDNAKNKIKPLFGITFLEQLSTNELFILMKETSIFIKSTEFDSFSFMVVEAMASGMIVIISSNVGAKDYIQHGINGFIYDKDSPEALYKVLKKLFANYYDLNSISKQATFVYNILNWDAISSRYLELYNS
ncbi:MAG: glycosyltransferase family 4 protein [Ignavibacteriales bacterium]|nr:glycosyltransferase family 4 protein [Ignavibacteriales bacterium]